jgi:hypothetical protein
LWGKHESGEKFVTGRFQWNVVAYLDLPHRHNPWGCWGRFALQKIEVVT